MVNPYGGKSKNTTHGIGDRGVSASPTTHQRMVWILGLDFIN